MGNIYCIYKNQKYKGHIDDGKIRMTTKVKQRDFKKYIDVLGYEHTDLFMKEISPEEAEMVYEEEIMVAYKDAYFQLFAGEVTQDAALNNDYLIWTESEKLADSYGFEKKEQFVFAKSITRKEIQAVKVVKKPLLCFKDQKEQEENLTGEKLIEWFKQN